MTPTPVSDTTSDYLAYAAAAPSVSCILTAAGPCAVASSSYVTHKGFFRG